MPYTRSFTRQEIIEIRLNRLRGHSYGELVKKFPKITNVYHARDIVTGKTYNWVPGAIPKNVNKKIWIANNTLRKQGRQSLLLNIIPDATIQELDLYRMYRRNHFTIEEAAKFINQDRRKTCLK